jgi:hypothetical protein
LLRLSIEVRSFSAFQYLLDNLLINQTINSSELVTDRIKTAKIRLKSAKTQVNLQLRNNLISIREYAEKNEIYEVIDILDNLGEDEEIKALDDEISFGNKARNKNVSNNNKNLGNAKFKSKYQDTSISKFENDDYYVNNHDQKNSVSQFESSYENKSYEQNFNSSQLCAII